MTNIRTTIGGAVSSLGTGLIGMSIVPQLAGMKSNWLLGITIAGYIVNLIGKFLTALFAADAKELKEVSETTDAIRQQTNINTVQIADTKKAVEDKLNT